MILGLDISTSRTGWALVSQDGKIYKYGAIDLTKTKDLFDKSEQMEVFLQTLLNEDIQYIYIEKSLKSFKKGKSSAQTIALLNAFNGIVSFICYKVFGIKPNYLSAIQARNRCGLKIQRGIKPKPIVVKYLLDTRPEFVVSYTKFGNVHQKHYDEADAIIMGLAGFVDECSKKR